MPSRGTAAGSRRRFAFLLVVIIGLVVLAGCGSDEPTVEPGAIETSSISKEEFIEKADEICTLGNRWLLKQIDANIKEQEAKKPDESPDALFTEATKKLVLPRVDANVKDIQALGAPQGDETELEAFLVQMHQEAVALQERTKISLDDVFGKAFNNAGELGRDYGLKACAY